MSPANLDKLFNPRGIAVIGASERVDSLGSKIFRNLVGVVQDCEVYPVNPFRRSVYGFTAYPSVTKIPQKVDLAVIATPAHTIPQIVEECGEAGVAGAVLISVGFRETGREGEALEQRILSCRDKYGIRIIGPNSFGIVRPRKKLFATFSSKQANLGGTAFVSQSAALCASAMGWSVEANVGFSAVVSTGSMLDVDLGDLIEFLSRDSQTKRILLYVESVKNARKFMSAARNCSRSKPIFLVKAGRFPKSKEAVYSHSGQMAGEDLVYDAAFKRVGIVRVQTINELFNCGEALSMQPLPKGCSLTVVTNAGGLGIIAADTLLLQGGVLAPLSPEVTKALEDTLPAYCRIANPLDIMEEATPERFKYAIEACFKNTESHGFIIIYTPQGLTDPEAFASTLTAAAKQTGQLVIACILGEDTSCRDARKLLRQHNIPAMKTPEEAVSAFMYMYRYVQNLDSLYEVPEELPVEITPPTYLRGLLRKACCEGRRVLTLTESLEFLDAYKINTAQTMLAKKREEAETAASIMGFPVVMKVNFAGFSHKSQLGGVVEAYSQTEVTENFDRLTELMKRAAQPVEVYGIAIQPLIRNKRHELFLGSKTDRQFGPVILFGKGGTDVAELKDVGLGFPPLNQALARRLIHETLTYAYTASSIAPSTMKSLQEVLLKFSQLILDFPEILEMDINPIILTDTDYSAVDARIVLDLDRIMREAAEQPVSFAIAPYPKEYTTIRTLKNGAKVILRPIRSEDERRFDELFKLLSDESKRFRFFAVLRELSHCALAQFCNIDYDREITIVAELQDGSKTIIGAAGLIVEKEKESGEFAILVSDPWQGLGLGSKLTDFIIDIAKNMHLKMIYAYTIPGNYKMINMCSNKGFEIKNLDDETVQLTFQLPD